MKFGESLRDGLVPEWKDQYVDYKEGKEIIKKCVEFKRKLEEDGLKSNDRTPLLEPINVGDRPYTQDLAPFTLGKAAEAANTKKRPSIFNYSVKSSKNKKEDYLAEKEKFQSWIDLELLKVSAFYQEKELEAYERFLFIQDQLYQLKEHKSYINQRRVDLLSPPTNEVEKVKVQVGKFIKLPNRLIDFLNRFELPSLPSGAFLRKFRKESKKSDIPLEYDHNYDENRIRNGMDSDEFDETSDIEDSTSINPREIHETEAQKHHIRKADYTIRKKKFSVPYVVAKKHLRTAILEHYRALSLLRSYRVLNRTACRKVTKKFDKSMGTSISKAFMQKIDETAYFQTSDLLEKLVNYVEDLYVGFFDPETEDRKHSLEKLKSIAYAMNNSDLKQKEYYWSFGFSLFCVGFGLPLLILGIYYALSKTITGELPEGKFLIQIWAGFFLLNLVLLLFGINIMVFDKYKINYKFIFEFDLSTALNWKQFLVIPSFGFALLSILFWFSFNNFWPNQFPGRDWPWIYFGVMLALFLWPGNHFYAASRRWLQVALWRLLLSGFYPVEFRDFFLGDILCSLTYTMGNISFFFCLYSTHWNGLFDPNDPHLNNVCGSSKSRLMGFFSALPTIFRFLQCVRRYMDTGDWFPHLANMLKYTISTIYYALLSVYRIQRIQKNRIVFIVFGAINSIYSCTWDIVMDWSLLQSGSKHKYLRNNLYYRRPIFYYFAVVADVLLRFLWIFYACFHEQIEQLAVTSFCIALAEIVRRFIWIFFRMENEHTTNTILFRASKDSPLPYNISAAVEKAIKRLVKTRYAGEDDKTLNLSENLDVESQVVSVKPKVPYQSSFKSQRSRTTGDLEALDGAPLSRRNTIFNLGETLHKAHIKDFQRKKSVYVKDSDEELEEDDDDGLLPGVEASSDNRSTGRERAGTLSKRHKP